MRTFCFVVAASLAAGAAVAQSPFALTKPVAPGAPAFIPAEIAPDAPEAMSGVAKRGDVVARHTVRAQESVVLTADVRGKHREVPAGTPLALAVLDPVFEELNGSAAIPTDPKRRAWCDVRPTGRMTFGSLDCFQDADGDGRFDAHFTGAAETAYFGFSLERLVPEPAVSVAGATYRVAADGERASTRVGYAYCGGGLDGAAPPRFSTALPVHKESWEGTFVTQCRFGVWPNEADKTAVRVDRLNLRTSPEGEGLRFEVLDRLPAGPVSRLAPGAPVVMAAERKSRPDQMEELVAQFREPVVKLTAAPAVVPSVKKGEAFLTAPAVHGVTGVLQNEVKPLGLFASGLLPVGTKVYGVPMLGDGAAGVVWCAPSSKPDSKGRVRWSAMCLPSDGLGHRWIASYTPLLARYLTWTNSTSLATPPVVARTDVAPVPGMTFAYRFIEWDKADADVEVRLLADGDDTWAGGLSLKREPDGSARLATLGGVIVLRQVGSDRRTATVEVVEPLSDLANLRY